MALPRLSRQVPLVLTLLATATISACGLGTRKGPPPDMHAHDPAPVYPALHGSVGEYAILSTNQDLHVEGYGLVVELPNTGGGEMPANVRDIVTAELERYTASATTQGIPSPDAILTSPRVAAVEVHGVIPALAPKNTVFDLTVSALPGSQTSSLKYGILWPTELMVIGLADEGARSRAMADGRGPMYFEPGPAPAALAEGTPIKIAPPRSMLKGRVVGGGITFEDMPAMLQLYNPSLHIVQSVQRVINFKFQEKPAIGASESVLNVMVPQRYRSDPHRFIELCQNFFLAQESPGFVPHKAQELLVALTDKTPQTPYRQLSIALEGLGTEILNTHLRPNYLSKDPVVQYYTARAGAALNDVQGIVVLKSIALDPKSPFRLDAVNELAADARITDNARAMMALGELLDAPSTDTRLAAYRGLIPMSTPAISHVTIPRKFDLDLVESNGPPMIYITQGGLPRIALIGKDFKMRANALYVSEDDRITVDCKTNEAFADWSIKQNLRLNGDKIPDEHTAVLYYRGALGNQAITLTSTSSLAAIITRLAYSPDPLAKNFNPREVFAGVSFQRIVEMIQGMSKNKLLDAAVYVEPAPPLIPTVNEVAEQARPEGLVYARHPGPQAAAPVTPAGPKAGS